MQSWFMIHNEHKASQWPKCSLKRFKNRESQISRIFEVPMGAHGCFKNHRRLMASVCEKCLRIPQTVKCYNVDHNEDHRIELRTSHSNLHPFDLLKISNCSSCFNFRQVRLRPVDFSIFRIKHFFLNGLWAENEFSPGKFWIFNLQPF